MKEKLKDIDFIFEVGTWIFLAIFLIKPSISSEMFIFYLLLSLFQIKKNGYKWLGLEPYMGLAMLGFAVSYIGNSDPKMGKYLIAQLKVFMFPLMIYQFKPIKNLEEKLFYFFGIAGVYGVLQILWIKSYKIGPNRYYAYMDFVMDSSIIALMGYILAILFAIKFVKENKKLNVLLSSVMIGIFIYLVITQQVRATYISFGIITLIMLGYIVYEIKNWKKYLILIGVLSVFLFGGYNLKNTNYARRLISIGNTKNNSSNLARLHYWEKAIECFKENPINGIGFRKFNKNNRELEIKQKYKESFTHAHNEFLGIIAELGIIGALLWYLFKYKYILSAWKIKENILGKYLLLIFIAFEIQNLFESYIVNRNMYRLLFILMGLILLSVKDRQLEKNVVG